MKNVAIIGGGPAGLMAAEVIATASSGINVSVYESMPTLGRKFLRAGLGGLNITHSEPYLQFCKRYGERQGLLQPALDDFTPESYRQWVHELGIETFVGSSGRVFPREMKAAPLLRTWLSRLKSQGVNFYYRHRWTGFAGQDLTDGLTFETPEGSLLQKPEAALLALGGASWPQLGSTGDWAALLAERGVEISPFKPANCSFDFPWSTLLKDKFANTPLKSVALDFAGERREGELMISESGLEGSLIYAFARRLRERIELAGEAEFHLDLLPGKSLARVESDLAKPRGSRSMSRHLQNCLSDDKLKKALLHEMLGKQLPEDPGVLAGHIKNLAVTVRTAGPLAEAISTAGGVNFSSLTGDYMLRVLPGVFAAGEMLDWEAPTGGYLLTACMATGRRAAKGLVARIN